MPEHDNSDDRNADQVRDQGTEKLSGEEVANAAAETLHGDRAEVETHPQPDATVLPGGSTLIADGPTPEDDASDR